MEITKLSQQIQSLLSGTARNIQAAFLIDRQTRGLKEGSLRFHSGNLNLFCNYLDRVGVVSIEEITPDIIRQYLLELASTRNQGGIHACFRSIRAMLNWYEEEFEPDDWKNPIKKIKVPGPNRNPLPGVSLEDVHKLVDSCSGEHKDRDRAILLCLLDTGARAFELINLNIGDVNFVNGSVWIAHGKGDKSRTVFLGSTSRKALRKYLKSRVDLSLNSPLFVNDEHVRFHYFGLASVIRRRSEKAGIKHPGLHDFRRCFAVQCLRNGMDLMTVSRLLGHSSISVTQRYLALVASDLEIAHKKAGPVDNAKW